MNTRLSIRGTFRQAFVTALSTTVTAPIGALVASVLYFRLLEIQRQQPPLVPASQDSVLE